MITAVLAIAGAHVGSLLVGGGIAAGLETALPFLTMFGRAKRAIAMARMVSRLIHGRDLNELEIKRISLDPTLTK